MEAIVLAGGFGTRLASRLEGIPKPMAPIGGCPFLEILLRHLRRKGCGRVLLSVGYLRERIIEHFGGSFGGMEIEYVVEEEPLGTGGAIRAALRRAQEPSALVLNGDTFLEADLAALLEAHGRAQARLTMAVVQQPDIARYGGVTVTAGHVTGFEEKGRTGSGWINAGVYAVARDLEWPKEREGKFSFERDFLMPQVKTLAPLAFAVEGFFLDIGVPEDLDRAQTALANF